MKLPIKDELRYWSEPRKEGLRLAQRDLEIAAHVKRLNISSSARPEPRSVGLYKNLETTVFQRPVSIKPFDRTSYTEVLVRAHQLSKKQNDSGTGK